MTITPATHAISINPATGEQLSVLPWAGVDDIENALQLAAAGFRDWREANIDYRAEKLRDIGKALRARSEEMAQMITREMGKPINQARAEVAKHILLIMGEWLAVQRRNGQLSDILFISLNDRLNDISAVLAGCERIAYTPIPFAYTLILHRTVYLFCIMLPFALVVDLHYMTPFISVLISYTFISLDCLAEELEDPFGTENNDLPLDAICNAIEIDLLQMNDEAEIPAKILPDRHYQLT
ncbi:bestrophin family ion channel [Escherichia coli]